MAVLGLSCCMWAFSSSGKWALLFIEGCRLLVSMTCCIARAREPRLSSRGAQAYLSHSTWNLPRPGIEPVSPALAVRFLTTGPPANSREASQRIHDDSLYYFLELHMNVWQSKNSSIE